MRRRPATASEPTEHRITVASVIRHALPSVLDGTIVPLVVFTVFVHTWGLRAALWASLAWAYSALVRRAVAGRRIPGILVLSTVGVTFRMATMIWTGSAFLFFVQPVLATAVTAVVFAVSAIIARPLAARLGADFVPLPAAAWSDPAVRRVCTQLSVLWSVALLANAGLTLWLLSHFSVATFVLLRPLVSVTTTLPAIAGSIAAGRAVLRRSGTRLAGPAPAEPALAEPVVAAPICCSPALALS